MDDRNIRKAHMRAACLGLALVLAGCGGPAVKAGSGARAQQTHMLICSSGPASSLGSLYDCHEEALKRCPRGFKVRQSRYTTRHSGREISVTTSTRFREREVMIVVQCAPPKKPRRQAPEEAAVP